MKIWHNYGSEHSMNLVMIGRFKDLGDAAKAKQVLDWLTDRVAAEVEAGRMQIDGKTERYSDPIYQELWKANIHTILPVELEQFAYGVQVKLSTDKVVITTDESEVSAFLKVLVHNGARVEVYSAHDYPETEDGR